MSRRDLKVFPARQHCEFQDSQVAKFRSPIEREHLLFVGESCADAILA
jgi:hypothetical protein